MKFIKMFVNFFTTITSGILVVITLLNLSNENIPSYTLVGILISGVVTALITTVVFIHDYKSTKTYIFACIVHFLVLFAVMTALGVMLGWIAFSLMDILGMAVTVAFVYAITWVVSYMQSKKEADVLNKALDERRK